MKAAILKKQGPVESNFLEIEEISIREPSPFEVLIKVEACGVCHTDLHILEGDLKPPSLPLILGHQIVGRIVKAGDGVKGFKPGDRVGVPWLHGYCGECKFCKKGLQNLCDNIEFTGFHVHGGFSEFTIAKNSAIYHLPDEISPAHLAPILCGGVIGYRALKLTELDTGGRLGLVGFGSSAHLVLQMAKYKGIETYIFSRSEHHRKHAMELGADWAGKLGENIGKKLDAIIVFAPAGELMVESLKYLEKGGVVVSAGIHMSQIPSFPYDLIYFERKIMSTANSTPSDVRETIELAIKIPIKTTVKTFELKDINTALYELKYAKLTGSAVITFD